MLNVDWLYHLPAPLRRGLYFGLQRCIGSQITATWGEFQTWERLTPEQLHDNVQKRLSDVLNTAVSQSEHYRSMGLQQRAGESGVEFLRRFPVLARTDVRQQFARLVIDPLRQKIVSPLSVSPRRYDWLVVKTGGTTGQPTSVVHDARARDWGRATRLYAAKLCGMPLGTRYFRLWGSEADLYQKQPGLHLRVLNNLQGAVGLNAFRAREAELREHHATMTAHPEIRHLMTYVDAAAGLALFIQEHSLPLPRFQTIMACAGTVTPDYRGILREIFSADVFDKYGSRDCCDMACECSYHTGLHVFSPNVYLEIVDDAGKECLPGKVGRILVTLLNNPSFPMIRYEVGDLAVWTEPGPCPCGSPFPRLQNLQGRQDDMLVTEDGTLQTPAFVRHFVGVSLNRNLIREWQLEQIARTQFIFRYIPLRPDGLEENLRSIHESFLLVFGKGADVKLEKVDEIPASATGKIRWIINSYSKGR
jgi:phenylacetate-CoA ligase